MAGSSPATLDVAQLLFISTCATLTSFPPQPPLAALPLPLQRRWTGVRRVAGKVERPWQTRIWVDRAEWRLLKGGTGVRGGYLDAGHHRSAEAAARAYDLASIAIFGRKVREPAVSVTRAAACRSPRNRVGLGEPAVAPNPLASCAWGGSGRRRFRPPAPAHRPALGGDRRRRRHGPCAHAGSGATPKLSSAPVQGGAAAVWPRPCRLPDGRQVGLGLRQSTPWVQRDGGGTHGGWLCSRCRGVPCLLSPGQPACSPSPPCCHCSEQGEAEPNQLLHFSFWPCCCCLLNQFSPLIAAP